MTLDSERSLPSALIRSLKSDDAARSHCEQKPYDYRYQIKTVESG